MSLEYLDLDKYLFDQFVTKSFIITVSYTTGVILALLFISLLIRKINTFNQSVVALYNEIKLWDATEMKNKCLKFIEKNATGIMKTHNNKRRVSSLLNVFPQETFLRVLESAQSNFENANKNNLSPKNLLNSSSEDDQLLKV